MNPRFPRCPARSLLADLLLAGLIVTLAVLNLRPVYVGRIFEQASWQHGWPVPCLWRHRAVEHLERQFGWLTPRWPVAGAPSGSYDYHRGAFLLDAGLALVLIAATARVSARLVRGRRHRRRLGTSTLVWTAGTGAAVALLLHVDHPLVEGVLTGFVCLGIACTLHALLLGLAGLIRRR